MQTDDRITLSETRWTLVSAEGLLWRSWNGEEQVLYHVASGDTHLINHVTAEVLRLLEHSDRRVNEIAATVADRLGTHPDAGTERYVGQLLRHLERIGLVEPLP